MNRAIYLDMDGTIANLYGQPNWLSRLRDYDASPYIDAQPLLDIEKLKGILSRFKANGYTVGVISWLSKETTTAYSKEVRQAKRQWLNKYFGENFFDEVHVVRYGTPKHRIAKVKHGCLMDDNHQVCQAWEKYGGKAIRAGS